MRRGKREKKKEWRGGWKQKGEGIEKITKEDKEREERRRNTEEEKDGKR